MVFLGIVFHTDVIESVDLDLLPVYRGHALAVSFHDGFIGEGAVHKPTGPVAVHDKKFDLVFHVTEG